MNGAVIQGPEGHIGILKAIREVMRESHGVEKDGSLSLGSSGTMQFMKIDDIVMEYRPLLIKHGIVTIPRLASETVYRDVADDEWTPGAPDATPPILPRQVLKGQVRKLRVHIVVEVETSFVYVEDGSMIVVRTPGESMDTQDKATRKAMTSAKKIAFIDLFQIISGDPEEDDNFQARIDREAPEDGPNRSQQKLDRAKVGAGTSAARDTDRQAPEGAPDDSEKRAKALLRETATKNGFTTTQLLTFGETVLDGRPRKEWLGLITKVEEVVKALGDDPKAKMAEFEAKATI